MIKSENLLHVKLEYEEGVQSKKDILSSERDLIRLIKVMRRYHLLRKEELDNKLRIYKKIKELKLNLTKLNQTLPKIKIPGILRKEEVGQKEKGVVKKKEAYDIDLETQLREIQERLRKLG